MKFMRDTWNKHIDSQKDNTIIYKIKKELNDQITDSIKEQLKEE